MKNRWKRWRGLMDGLEEAMRCAAVQLEETAGLLRRRHEWFTWTGSKRKAACGDLVRRARDMPFFRDLLSAADELRALSTTPDVALRPWEEGETVETLLSSRRFRSASSGVSPEPPTGPETQPPERLRSVERALAGRTRSLVVLLEEIPNPANASGAFRTADAFGLQEVHMVHAAGKPPVFASISSSAHRYLDLHVHRSTAGAVAALRSRGYRILAADIVPEAVPLAEVTPEGPICLAFGSEQLGVSSELREAADGLFCVPTVGFTSYLNLSVTVAVAVSALDARLRAAGARAPLAPAELPALRRAWYVAMARGDRDREASYLRWLDAPPEPAPGRRTLASREKAAAAGRRD